MTQTKDERLQEIAGLCDDFRTSLPGFGRAYAELNQEAFAGGELDPAMKRLMGLAIAVTHGCEGCMLFQADQALALGATPGQVLEACAVAVSLGGTMAQSKTATIMALLQERDLV